MAKILLVEDYPSLQKLYEDELSSAGHNVVVANNGKTALEVASHFKPDLVLLDLLMQEVDGLGFLKSYDGSNAKIIILSNLASPGLRQEAAKLGAVSYLIKSELTPKQVVEEAEKVLNNRRKTNGPHTAS